MRIRRRALCASLFLVYSYVCFFAAGQQASTSSAPAPPKRPNIPDTFTNLRALPATLTKPELLAIMKQFSVTFKVRCSSCHAVSDDLSEGNFASDEKPMKNDARKLIQLLQQPSAIAK